MNTEIKYYKKYALIILLTLITVIILLISLTPNVKAFALKDTNNDGLESYTSSALSYGLGCGNIYKQPNAGSISMEIPQEYYTEGPSDGYIPAAPTAVPIYGYLAERGMDSKDIKFYDTETVNKKWTEQYILRTMWDNKNITLWYNPETITDKELDLIKALDETYPNTILSLPWLSYDGAKIPAGRTFAYSKLGYSQTCDKYSLDVLVQFAKLAKDEPIKYDENPKMAKLDRHGNLAELDANFFASQK